MVVTKEIRFADIFRRINSTTYAVPKFQRGYSWGNEQITDFWDDLVAVNDKDDGSRHFFGVIYCSSLDDLKYQIVDGQQRITTAAIFLICARDYFYQYKDTASKDPEEILKAANAKRNYEDIQFSLYQLDKKHQPDLFKFYLTLSRTNKDFFVKKIVPEKKLGKLDISKYGTENDSNISLAEAYSKFATLIQATYGDDVDAVNFLVFTLLEKLEMVRLTVPTQSNVHRMFNLINNRGLPLDDSDLIKNTLFASLEDDCRKKLLDEEAIDSFLDEYDGYWLEFRTNVTSKDKSDYSIEDFISNYLVYKEFPDHQKKDLYDTIEKLLEKTSADSIINGLLESSEKFINLRKPYGHFDKNQKTIHNLEKIAKLNPQYVYTVLLSGYETYYEEGDKKSFEGLTEICLKYHLRTKSIPMGINLEKYRKKLHKVASMITDDQHTPKINQLIDELVKDENSYPPDDKFKIVLNTLKVNSNVIAIPLLEMLEGDEDNGKVSGSDVSVEHVMPQNSKKWIEYIISKHDYLENVPDGDEHDEVRDKAQKDANEKAKSMHSKYLSWLGNQTLLSIPLNSKIKNDSFEIKKSHYKNGYKITGKLVSNDDWTEKEIIDRQTKFAKKLLEHLDLTRCKN
jgi:uncharacterized protein with ParB-like and HNH nuclease domain